MAEILSSITLGGQSFPVAQISFSQAQTTWSAFERAANLVRTEKYERIAALKGVIFQCCRAANPSFPASTLDELRGVKAADFWALLEPVGILIGYIDPDAAVPKDGDTDPGEAAAGGAPAI